MFLHKILSMNIHRELEQVIDESLFYTKIFTFTYYLIILLSYKNQ